VKQWVRVTAVVVFALGLVLASSVDVYGDPLTQDLPSAVLVAAPPNDRARDRGGVHGKGEQQRLGREARRRAHDA
jgi:hypothetical protein